MQNDRLKVLQLAFFLSAVIILLRLFYWQVLNSDSLETAAENQYLSRSITSPGRGKIFTSDNFPLVTNQNAYELVVDTKELKIKKSNLTSIITPIIYKDLNLNFSSTSSAETTEDKKLLLAKDLLKSKIEDSESQWIVIADKISQFSKDSLQNLNLPGISFNEKERRFYPEGSMSAQLLGFVGKDQFGKDKGYFGIEGYYDRELKGKEGYAEEEKDPKGRPILFGYQKVIEKEDGRDLTLNIDRTIQYIVEEKLREGILKYGAKQGSVTVLDPKSGSVLAMYSYPAYVPSKYFEFDKALYKNPIVADSYEPGSTFKVLVMAAAVNEGLVKPDTICDKCAGPREIAGYTIRTWNNQYYPNTTMTEVIQHSDNTGMIFAGEKLGREKFLSYLKDYGFGDPTGIDLEEETSPYLRPDKNWSQIDLTTASFGQGIAVTSIQMARAVASIANGGLLIEPHVVSQIKEKSGKVIAIQPKVVKRVLKPSAATIVTEMMVNAVDNGEAKYYKPKGYRIAGKTGTSQIPVSGHYDATKTVASFVGFAPADNPRFLILVTLNEPTSSPWGSETAAPLFFNIAKEIFNYYQIPAQ